MHAAFNCVVCPMFVFNVLSFNWRCGHILILILRIPCFLSVLFLVILELSSEQVGTMHGYNGCKDSHFRIQFLPGLRLIAIFPCHILHAKRAIPSLALHTLSSLFRSIIYWFFKKNPIASFSLSYSECSLVVALYFGLFIFWNSFSSVLLARHHGGVFWLFELFGLRRSETWFSSPTPWLHSFRNWIPFLF